MEKYLGVKLIEAEFVSKHDCTCGSKDQLHDCNCEQVGVDGYKVVYEDGYTSWSPKDVFEKAYKKYNDKCFGIVIDVDTRDENWDFMSY